MHDYRQFSMRPFYEHCGYAVPGHFDWEKAYLRDVDQNEATAAKTVAAMKERHVREKIRKREEEASAVQRFMKKNGEK